jgi:DNA-binding CsgD family transcriptional regulator
MNIRKKVEINPSYEWAEGTESLGISHRELEVFALVAEGYTNKEVAEILHIKHQSVKNHMHNFFKKLGVKNSGQAVIVALHKNLIKMRGIYGEASVELTAEGLIERFRDLINGQAWISGVNEKEKRRLKVFLLSHGIDIDKLENRGEKKQESA